MAAKKPPVKHSADPEGAVEDAFSEIEALKEEIESWKDSLEGNNMEALPKYEEVSECHGALEDLINEKPEFSGTLPEDIKAEWSTPAPKRRGLSRAGRAAEASQALSAAADALSAYLDEHDEEDEVWSDGSEDNKAARSDVEEFKDAIEAARDNLDNVSFPGMY